LLDCRADFVLDGVPDVTKDLDRAPLAMSGLTEEPDPDDRLVHRRLAQEHVLLVQ
jgi:hypothetical protein